jgi:hypothetical protein
VYDHPPEEGSTIRAVQLLNNGPAEVGAQKLTRLRDRVYDAFTGLLP